MCPSWTITCRNVWVKKSDRSWTRAKESRQEGLARLFVLYRDESWAVCLCWSSYCEKTGTRRLGVWTCARGGQVQEVKWKILNKGSCKGKKQNQYQGKAGNTLSRAEKCTAQTLLVSNVSAVMSMRRRSPPIMQRKFHSATKLGSTVCECACLCVCKI